MSPCHSSPPFELPDTSAARAAAGLAVFDGHGGDTLFSRIEGFLAGTLVLSGRGYVPVEALRAGDTVRTRARRFVAVLWCRERRLDAAAMARRPALAPVRIAAGALGPGLPGVDLRLAPDQTVASDDGAVPAAHLVDGSRIIREAAGSDTYVPITYVTLGLAAGSALMVSGVACPTGRVAQSARGAVALRRRIARNAGSLRSQIEAVSPGCVVGWALDEAFPAARVAIEVLLDGAPVGWGIADQRRPDLEMAGLGDGACAFNICFEPREESGRGRMIEVRRTDDGTQLTGSPILLPPPDGDAGTLADAVRVAITPARTGAERVGVATTLLLGIDGAILAAGLRAPFSTESGA